MEVVIQGKRVRVQPNQGIGKGGEADVYDLGNGKALKVFKGPKHADYDGLPLEQQGAIARISEHQRKLPAFPRDLPPHVVVPEALAYDRGGATIVGYVMALISGAELLRRYGERAFRTGAIPNDVVVRVFRDLHTTVSGIHARRVVIGDFNDLNVLVRGEDAFLIDADSFQFGTCATRMYTQRFVDPTRCDPNASSLVLAQPHTATSDWYAFAVMLMQSLLFVDPYGGVYRPKDPAKRARLDERPLRRITVFHPDVTYPKPAVPYGVLPDELLDYFHRVFERDERGEFPRVLLEGLRWTTCAQCGTEHARNVCPTCAAAIPAALKQRVVIRGTVTATRVFATRGDIVAAAVHGGALRWLVHEHGAFRREDGAVILAGERDPRFRYRIAGERTLIARDDVLVTLAHGHAPEQRAVERYRSVLPVFDTNATRAYWVEHGALYRDGDVGIAAAPVRIGNVLANQTLFWVGERFGFGCYRAGELSVAFVFDAMSRGINDAVALPRIRGQLVDAVASFADARCWFFTAAQEGGATVHRVSVIAPDGSVIGSASAIAGDGSWLGGSIRGHAAVGDALLAATDDGVVRIEASGGSVAVTREFPDTEPFVHSSCQLLAGRDGLYVVDRREITKLVIR